VLTAAGLDRLQAAWPTHLASVRRHVMDHFGDIDLRALAEALGRIAPEAGCLVPGDLTCLSAPPTSPTS
jgi:hypothetical protein